MPTPEEILAAIAATKAPETPAPELPKEPEVKEPEPEPVAKVSYDEAADLNEKTAAIIAEFGGFSNIPLNSAYWGYMNRLRQLVRNENA